MQEEHNPEYYDTEVAENLFKPIYPVIAEAMIKRSAKTHGDVLDFGCGGGHLGIEVIKQGSFDSLSFFDCEPRALELACQRAQEQGIQAQAYQGDACSVTPEVCGGRTFDLIVSRGSRPFWDDQKAAFTHIGTLLNPGGVAYIGGGMGNAKLAKEIGEKMKKIREAHGGEGPRLFDHSRSKALPDNEYVELLEGLGYIVTIIHNDDEGRWVMFERPIG